MDWAELTLGAVLWCVHNDRMSLKQRESQGLISSGESPQSSDGSCITRCDNSIVLAQTCYSYTPCGQRGVSASRSERSRSNTKRHTAVFGGLVRSSGK